jgi:hypothetical protein
MPIYKYSSNESFERISSILGGVNPDDAEETLGRKPWNESLALIAQLLEGSLEGSRLSVPIQKFGQIYTWTGTATFTGMTTSWTKLTGTFQNSGEVSDTGITLQPTSSQILINDWGVYFVSWQMSYIGSPDLDYKVEPYCFVGMPQAAAQSTPRTSGTITSMGGSGFAEASGSAIAVSLYLKPSATAWIIPQVVQLSVMRVGV